MDEATINLFVHNFHKAMYISVACLGLSVIVSLFYKTAPYFAKPTPKAAPIKEVAAVAPSKDSEQKEASTVEESTTSEPSKEEPLKEVVVKPSEQEEQKEASSTTNEAAK